MHTDRIDDRIKVTNEHQIVAGPLGFEPRFTGSGGLRTALRLETVRRLNPNWATGPPFVLCD